jgi:hypothetical protein
MPRLIESRRNRLMKGAGKVEDLVFREVGIRCPGMNVSRDQRLIEDLRLLPDDAGEIAIVCQRNLGVKIANHRWSTVRTVREMIDLLEEYTSG